MYIASTVDTLWPYLTPEQKQDWVTAEQKEIARDLKITLDNITQVG